MKRVDLINTTNLNSPTGPAVLLNKYLKHNADFKNRGYEITLITPEFFKVENQQLNKKNQSIEFVKKWLRSKAHFSKLISSLLVIKIIFEAKKLIQIYNKAKRSPDIVIFDEYFVCEQYLKTNKSNAKKVLFFHTDGLKFEMLYTIYPKIKNTLLSYILEKRYKKVLPQIDKIVFITGKGQTNFITENPQISKTRTTFFHNGVEDLFIDEKNIKSENNTENAFKYRLICSGTVSERKGQYIIIEALLKINRQILKDIHVSFIGSGSQLEYLIQYVNKNNLSQNVSFEGSIQNHLINKYLFKSNIFILMSRNEGLPISIIEAMRAGLPIISTRIAGIPELVEHGKNGILLDPDIDQLTTLLNNLDNYDWDSMGNHSRVRYEREFTFNRMLQNYCDMLDSLNV